MTAKPTPAASRRIPAVGVIAILLFTLLPLTDHARADCSFQHLQMTSAQTTSTSLIDPTCLRDDGGGGGGGGGGGTDPTLRWFDLEGEHVGDKRDPLARFTALPVKALDTDADGVVHLQPVPYLARTQDEYAGAVVNLSNAQVGTLLGTFQLTKELVAKQVHDLLTLRKELHPTRDEAVRLINNLQYTEAANLILNKTTPAEVYIWCGSFDRPLFVRWVLGIPAVFQCAPDAAKSAPILARATTSQTVDVMGAVADQNVGAVPGDKRISTMTIELMVAGTSEQPDGTRYLAGFTYSNASVGGQTRIDQSWHINATIGEFTRLANGITYAARWERGLPGDVLDVGSFASGDRILVGNGTTITRGHAFWAELDGAETTLRTGFEFKPDPQELSSGLVVVRGATGVQPANVGLRGFTIEPNSTTAISGMAAMPDAEPIRVSVNSFPSFTKLWFAGEKPGEQRKDVPNDTAELKATLYLNGVRDTTVQSVGLPGVAIYRFAMPTDNRAGAGGAEVAVGSDELWYRTVLITHHDGSKTLSATGDYTRRAVVWAGAKGDPVGVVANDAYRYYAAHFTDALTWSTFRTNVTTEGAHVAMAPGEMEEEDGNRKSGAVWAHFKNGVESAGWVENAYSARAPDIAATPKLWVSRLSSMLENDCKFNVQLTCIEG